MSNTLRDQAKTAFQKILRSGRQITLRQFADEFEEGVPIATIRQWSMQDSWFENMRQLDTAELAQQTVMFGLAYDCLMEALEAGLMASKEAAAQGRTFREICKKLHPQALHIFEEDIEKARDDIFKFTTKHFKKMIGAHSSSLYKTWTDLGSLVVSPMVEDGEQGTIDPDSLLMSGADG